jgi:hypothetical protein
MTGSSHMLNMYMHAMHEPQSAAPPHAGPPPDTDISYCPDDGDTCYFYSKVNATWANSNAACSQSGGYMVSYSDFQEQSQVRH